MATWKKVPGLPGYEASTGGEIKCLATDHVTKGGDAGRYLKVEIARGGKRVMEYVHILVCTAFHGKGKRGEVVLHKDNDCFNNKPSNLKWGTQSENIQQSYDDNRVPKKKPSVENYLEYRVAIEERKRHLRQVSILDDVITNLDGLQSTMERCTDIALEDPMMATMVGLTIKATNRRIGFTKGHLEHPVGLTYGLEDMTKVKTATKATMKQVVKALGNTWDRLMDWFKVYIKDVGVKCKDLRSQVRTSKITITKESVDIIYKSNRDSMVLLNTTIRQLSANNGKSTPELVITMEDVSKSLSDLVSSVSTDTIKFVDPNQPSNAASPDGVDRTIRAISEYNDTVGKLNKLADKIMSSAEKQINDSIKESEQSGTGDGSKGTVSDNNKQTELSKFSSVVQSINRNSATLTKRSIGFMTKALSNKSAK